MNKRSWMLLVCATACSDSETPAVEVPADWQRVETRCQFGFEAPPEIVEVPTQGIDSCVVQFSIDGCRLHGDVGGFTDRLNSYDDQAEHVLQMRRVDGEDATLVTYRAAESPDAPYFSGVYIPKARDPFGADVGLSAWCDSQAAQSRATLILRTITSSL